MSTCLQRFQIEREIITWLMEMGFSFSQSLSVISYAIETDSFISTAHVTLSSQKIIEEYDG